MYAAKGIRPEAIGRQGTEETYVTSIVYDEFGQRKELTLGNGVTTKYDYEPNRRRLRHLDTTRPGSTPLQALTYDYDGVGNVKSVVNGLGEPVGRRAGEVKYTYTYDSLDRLVHATGNAKARLGVTDTFTSDFQYSGIHNLTRNTQVRELVRALATDGPTREVLSHSTHDWEYVYPEGKPPHQVSRIGDTLFTYDANGNTTSECEGSSGGICDPATSRVRRFVWDESNRLKAVVDGTGTTAQFLYDSNGQRVVKVGRGTSIYLGQYYSTRNGLGGTKHIFAGSTRIASKVVPKGGPRGGIGNDTNTPGASLPPGCDPSDGQPQKCDATVISVAGFGYGTGFKPATYYYHPDHLGSTNWVSDQFARVHERVEYFPYGEVWREGRDDEPGQSRKIEPYLFTGKEYDVETGLTYFGARYYNAAQARWLNPDPALADWTMQGGVKTGSAFQTGNYSLYAYARHNPLAFKDPDGREATIVVGDVPKDGAVTIGGRSIPYRIDDPRKLPGFDAAVRRLARSFGAPDIRTTSQRGAQATPVQYVKSASEIAAEFHKSRGGSKVYVGHSALSGPATDPKTFAIGVNPSGGEVMAGHELGALINRDTETAYALMCAGGTLSLDSAMQAIALFPGITDPAAPRTAIGPDRAQVMSINLDFTPQGLKAAKARGCVLPEDVKRVKSITFTPVNLEAQAH